MPIQKLYCYVDETGQDTRSEFFVVVALVTDQEQETLRNKLLSVEKLTKVGVKKWHKLRSAHRLQYLREILSQGIGKNEIFFGKYRKPLPYFLPILETIEKGIRLKAQLPYRTIVIIDGIDYKKATELTGALRLRNITLELVRSARDESEPLLRLTDRWAGCIRAATEKTTGPEAELVNQALQQGYLYPVEIKKSA